MNVMLNLLSACGTAGSIAAAAVALTWALRKIAENLMDPKTQALLRAMGKAIANASARLESGSFYQEFEVIQGPLDRFEMAMCWLFGGFASLYAFAFFAVAIFAAPSLQVAAKGLCVGSIAVLIAAALFARGNFFHRKLYR